MHRRSCRLSLFLSTPSARRATIRRCSMDILLENFYPRPPRGGRRVLQTLRQPSCCISIHALREEGDCRTMTVTAPCAGFLSTPSARRATCGSGHLPRYHGISIHALREEGDRAGSVRGMAVNLFLSTPSARRATAVYAFRIAGSLFLSTPSARRATGTASDRGNRTGISIHALREEGDGRHTALSAPVGIFLSTPSARRATCAHRQPAAGRGISIHALREEGDTENSAHANQYG